MTTTNEVVVPKPAPPPIQTPALLPRFTSAQIVASFAALGRPVIQTAIIPQPTQQQGWQTNCINWGCSTTEEAAYEHAHAPTPTITGRFKPSTPPTEPSDDELSDVQMLEQLSVVDKPLPIPPPTIKHSTNPSLFTPPKVKVQIPKIDPPSFPLSKFIKWMKDSKNQDKLLSELVQNESPLIEQFSTFSCICQDADEIKKVHESAKALWAEFDEFKKLSQWIDKWLDNLFTKIAKAEDKQHSLSHMLWVRLPDQQLMKDTPGFFQRCNDWTAPTSSIPQFSNQPWMQEDFECLPWQQWMLFYNQSPLNGPCGILNTNVSTLPIALAPNIMITPANSVIFLATSYTTALIANAINAKPIAVVNLGLAMLNLNQSNELSW